MIYKIQRITFSATDPTYGVWLNDDVPQCVTLERPWLDNAVGLSCIPPGTYQVIQNSELKPWRLQNVPGRTLIDIHAGNTIADIEGCIALGTLFFPGGILQSQDAVNFMKKILPATFQLTILNP